jgi:hypothetical protein
VNRKGLAVCILLAAVIIGLALFYFLQPREPVYQGKPRTAWLEQFGTNYEGGGIRGESDLKRQAETAIRQIGTNGAPFYLQLMTTHDSRVKVKLLRMAQKPWLARFHFPQVADYRQALAQAGLIASMSRCGNCYDNATMESFWAALKLELVYRRAFDTRAQARTQIFDYIETFYNRQRAHSALDYHSPVDFETLNN